MFLKKNWLPFSVFLIVIVMVGLYVLQTRPEKAPIKIYKTTEVEKPTQPQAPVGDTSQGGHFHADGTWHEGPHEVPVPAPVVSQPAPIAPVEPASIESFTIHSDFAAVYPPAGAGPDWASMSPEELQAAIAAINNNPAHPPDDLWPPEGYEYKKYLEGGDGGEWKVRLDDNGYPILHKRGEPFFGLIWGEGFRPSPEQYAEYVKLSKEYDVIRAQTVSSPELDRIVAQMDEMERKYRGPLPAYGYGFAVPWNTDMEKYHARAGEISSQLRAEAYRREGLDYLIDW